MGEGGGGWGWVLRGGVVAVLRGVGLGCGNARSPSLTFLDAGLFHMVEKGVQPGVQSGANKLGQPLNHPQHSPTPRLSLDERGECHVEAFGAF